MATQKKSTLAIACGALLLLSSSATMAIEGNGLPIYPDGLESYMSGALPGPGVHLLMYGGAMRYNSVRDHSGDKIPVPGFKVDVAMVAPRVVWVTPQQIAGGQLAFHALFPLLTVKEQAMGLSKRRSGLGDIAFGPALGYHFSDAAHAVVGVDFVAPTGRYKKGEMANLGRNYWTIQPAAAFTYTQPSGINFDLKAMVDFNMRNSDTRTRTGHAIHADYALGYGFGNGWVAGVGGYAYQQFQKDNGPFAGDGKARSFGFGPTVRYANPNGWLFTAKWQQDFGVRSRPKGHQLLAKVAIPF